MSDITPESPRDLIEEYVLDLLDGAERTAIEARIAADPVFARDVATARETLTTLALSMPVALPSGLKARVMAHATDAQHRAASPVSARVLPFAAPAPRSRASLWLGTALAASLAIMVWQQLGLQRERARVAEALATVSHSAGLIEQRDSVIARLSDPGLDLITLAATGQAKPAVKMYLDRTRRTAFITVASLEQAPAGREYQLWFMVGGKPVPSVSFVPGADGRALVQDVALPEGVVAATAITLEPAGGSPAPTSPILFVGAVKAER